MVTEAMEGQARQVRGEGKDGRGGGEPDKSTTMAMTKLSPSLCRYYKNKSNNQLSMVGASESKRMQRAMEGKVRERGERGKMAT